MSSVNRRKTGYYYLDLRVEGKRKRISLDTTNRTLAHAKAKMYLRELGTGRLPSVVTIGEFFDEYLVHAAQRKTKNSLRSDRTAIEKFKAFSSARYLDDVTAQSADKLITAIASAPRSDTDPKTLTPAGINYYIRTLRAIFQHAVRWKYLQTNPLREVKLFRHEQQLPRILSVQEIGAVLSKTTEMVPALRPLFEFYLLTGMRRSEALNLQWSDVDFGKKIIVVRRTKSHRPRIMPMIPRVVSLLRSRRELDKPFLFEESFVTHKFKKIAVAAGVPDVTLHDLRRSFASYIQDAGMPTLFVTWLIGHANNDVTRMHYTGYDNLMVLRYLNKMEKRLLP